MPTIADVAARAGVSPATVSRVVNDRKTVAQPTRERVLAAIEELDYTPNPTARALSLGQTATICVVAPAIDSPSIAQRLHGVASKLNTTPYDLMLNDVETAAQSDRLLNGMATPDRVAAVITISIRPAREQLAQFAAAEVPVVVIDGKVPKVDCVFVDDAEGGRMAAGSLLSAGHSDIAFVGDHEDSEFDFTSSRDRRLAFEGMLATAAVTIPDDYTELAPHGTEGARQATHELLDLGHPPTAIFAASDAQAIGVLEAAYSRDLSVPGDLSLVGFDDIASAKGMGLTTIRQPLEESGSLGVRLALEAIENRSLGMAMELPLELVTRRSVGPPRAK